MDSRTLPIAVVARETGLSKELLRKWEDRYGFPQPLRSATGVRSYPLDQVEALRAIKRHMDAGARPSEAIRARLADGRSTGPAPAALRPDRDVAAACLRAIREHDVEGLYGLLDRNLISLGVQRFIAEVAAPLTVAVGEGWLRGELRVHEEHLFSAALATLLSELHRRLRRPAARPRFLLTTPPGELHTLGLDMVRVLLAEAGAECISLGAQAPLAEIAAAVAAYDVRVLGLSFSAAYPARLVAPTLAEVRALLPPGLPVWIGGGGALTASRLPADVRVFVAAGDVVGAVLELQENEPRPVG